MVSLYCMRMKECLETTALHLFTSSFEAGVSMTGLLRGVKEDLEIDPKYVH